MPLSVLVIDDQPLEGEMISYILHRDRPEVTYAGQALNAADGIRMAGESRPDLIFLDIKMPGMDGLAAISHLRRASPRSRIIMLTAFDDYELFRAALRAGAQDYLLKPVRPAGILAALDETGSQTEESAAPPSDDGPDCARVLTQAILDGDENGAAARAQSYLAAYGVTGGNLTYTCACCMKFAAELTQAAAEKPSADALTYLYQDFVRRVSSVQSPEVLTEHFTGFARQAAGLLGNGAGEAGLRQVAEAKQYISAHLHEPLQLSDIARRLYLSTAYFSRLFKEKTGMTFSEYLAGCRVERARRLLATTDLSVSEVAAAIGYQEANSFSRLFKTRTGQTPSDYRASLHRS